METEKIINPKQDVLNFQERLNKDFKRNYLEFIKFYNKNRDSKAFIKFFIKSDILKNNFNDFYLDYIEYKEKKGKNSILHQIILDYFLQDKEINIEFIKNLTKIKGTIFQELFFKNQLFLNLKHVDSLKHLFSPHDKFLKLAYFLNKINTDILFETKSIDKILKNISFEELLITITYYLNVLSIRYVNEGNSVNAKISDIIASSILNRKIKLDNKIYTLNEYKLMFNCYNYNIPKEIKLSKKLFEHFNKVMTFNDIITDFKYNEFNYNFLKDNVLRIFPKNEEDYLEFKKSGLKGTAHELILSSIITNKFKDSKLDILNKETGKNILNNTTTTIALLGDEITLNKQKVKFSDMIWVISKLNERNKRMFNNKLDLKNLEESIIKVSLNNINLGNGWGYINTRTEEDLVNASLSELKKQLKIELTPAQIIEIFDFFSTDINNPACNTIDLVKKPFIKIDNHYIWGYSSLQYKDLYKIITMNVFSNPQEKENFIKNNSNKFENKICEMFKNANFKAVSQHTVKNSKNNDIDVMAYKDGYLFIIEGKITYSRLDYDTIRIHTEETLKKAENQLNYRVKKYLDYLDDETIRILEIDDISSLTIIPLIVTNSFEGKCICGNGIYKLSEYELAMYLDKKSPDALIKMIEGDYFWNLFNNKELLLLNNTSYKFKNLEVIKYV